MNTWIENLSRIPAAARDALGTLGTLRTLARPRAFAQPAGGTAEPVDAGELAWADGLFFGRQPMERWNGDDLAARKGSRIYRRMMHDDQLRALVSLKRAVVTSRRWRFDSAQDDVRQRECADFFAHVLTQQLRGTFAHALGGMLSSQTHGFSVTEKVYGLTPWRGRKLWGLDALKLRPPETFSFQGDAHGNLTAIVQEQAGQRVELPAGKFVVLVNKPEVDPFYGESDLRECYRHWWAKDNVLKFWNIYLERLAAGFVHGRVSGPLTPGERDDLKQVLRNLSAQTSIVTPANVELKMLTAPSTDAFERAVAARDKAMAKALLVPNLLGFSEQGQVGSFSQSRTQLETFFLVMNGVADGLAEVLNEQVFRELARENFGLSDPPRFVFDPLTDVQRRQLAESWLQALSAGAVTPTDADERRTRELLDYPAALAACSAATSEPP